MTKSICHSSPFRIIENSSHIQLCYICYIGEKLEKNDKGKNIIRCQ